MGYFVSYTGASSSSSTTASAVGVAFSPASAPGYAFNGDKTSGLGATAAGSVYLAVNGASVISMASGAATVVVPLTLSAALSAQGGSFATAVQFGQGISVVGVAALSGGVTLAQGAQLLNAAAASPAGTVTAPPGSLFLSTSGGTGSTLWVKEANIDATGWRAFTLQQPPTYPLLAPNQTALAPAYSFTSSASSGMFSPTVNALGFSTNQVERLRIDATGNVLAYGPVTVSGLLTGQAGASFVGTANVAMGGNLNVTGNIYAANFNGGVTGAASANVLKSGDTMTGALQINVAAGAAGLGTTGSVLFSSTLQVSALSTLASLTVTGASNLGNTAINGTAQVSGLTTLSAALTGTAATFTGLMTAQTVSLSAAGTAAAAAITLQTAGMYFDSAHTGLGFAIGGVEVAYINAAGLTVLGTASASNLSGSNTGDVTLGTAANGLSLTGQVLTHNLASATAAGALSAADWATFNNKASAGAYVTSLTGDVTATGPGAAASTVALVGGSTAALVHSAELLANAATAANTANTLVKRDVNGAFSAGVIGVVGSTFVEQATDLTQKISLYVKSDHNLYFQNSLGTISQINNPATTYPLLAPNGTIAAPSYAFASSASTGLYYDTAHTGLGVDVAGVQAAYFATAGLTVIGTVGASNLSGTNTGDVTLGAAANGLSLTGQVLTHNLASGTAAGALSAADWTTFNNKAPAGAYLTALTGDVTATGPGSAASTVALVGGSTAALVHSAELLANAAVSTNTASTLVKRDASGGFSAGLVGVVGNTFVEQAADLTTKISLYVKADHNLYYQNSTGVVTQLNNPATTYPLLAPNGTLAAPSYAFSAAASTGLYYDTAHTALGVDVGGTQAAYFAASGLTVVGTLSASNLSGTNTGDVTLGAAANGLSLTGQVLTHNLASGTANGALSSTDWNTFNNKAPAGAYITSLTGDVTATGPGAAASTVALVGGSTAAQVHSAELLANAATAANTASTLVKRDSAGAFAAGVVGVVGATFVEQATDLTQSISLYVKSDHNLYFKNSTGIISQLNNPATTYPLLAPNGTVAAPSYAFSGATSTGLYYDTAHTGLGVDVAGVQAAYFAAAGMTVIGTIGASNLSGTNTGDVTLGAAANGLILTGQVLTHNLASGTANGALSSTDWNTFNNKASAGSYITALTGDVTATGPGSSAATVALVGGSTAALVHSAELLANAAVSTNTASTLVKRDASGGFSAGVVGHVGATFVEQAADLTQAISLYVKTDHNLYYKNSSGVVAQLNNPASAVTFPLAAPTGTTAAPNYAYSFSGTSTSGLAYDTTQNAAVLYAVGNAALSALSTGVVRIPGKLSVATATTANCSIAVGDSSVSDVQHPIQINATTGNNGVYYGVTNGAAGIACSFGYNLYPAGGYTESTLIRTVNAKPFYLVMNNSPTYALSASSVGNVGIGSGTLAVNKLDVFGSMGIGAGVAGVTAAPANGLLVQGPTVLQGNLALTETGTAPAAITNAGQLYAKSADHNLYYKNNTGAEYALTPPGSPAPRNVVTNAAGGNFTATASQTGSLFTLPGGSSIILPPATLGLEFELVNTSTPAARFVAANNTDTITFNGVAVSGAPATAYIQSLGQVITLTCWSPGQWIATNAVMPGYAQLQEQAAPPALSAATTSNQANTGLLYAKSTDHNLYFKNSLGSEYPLTPTGAAQIIGTGGNVTATAAQSGSVAVMTGPGTLTLPSATAALAGSNFTLTNSISTNIAIQTAAGDTIYYADPITGTNALTNKASGTNYTLLGAPIGATFTVLCVALNKWVVTTLKGAGWA